MRRKPFDIDAALAGFPVVTRLGRPANDIKVTESETMFNVSAVVDGETMMFTDLGASDVGSYSDLFMTGGPKEKTAQTLLQGELKPEPILKEEVRPEFIYNQTSTMRKPFDIDAALAGEPVFTRSGDPVTEIHLFDCVCDFPLFGVLNGTVCSFTKDGKFSNPPSVMSNKDLFMGQNISGSGKKKAWVAVYRNYHNELCSRVIEEPEEVDEWKKTKDSPHYKGVTVHEIEI